MAYTTFKNAAFLPSRGQEPFEPCFLQWKFMHSSNKCMALETCVPFSLLLGCNQPAPFRAPESTPVLSTCFLCGSLLPSDELRALEES